MPLSHPHGKQAPQRQVLPWDRTHFPVIGTLISAQDGVDSLESYPSPWKKLGTSLLEVAMLVVSVGWQVTGRKGEGDTGLTWTPWHLALTPRLMTGLRGCFLPPVSRDGWLGVRPAEVFALHTLESQSSALGSLLTFSWVQPQDQGEYSNS